MRKSAGFHPNLALTNKLTPMEKAEAKNFRQPRLAALGFDKTRDSLNSGTKKSFIPRRQVTTMSVFRFLKIILEPHVAAFADLETAFSFLRLLSFFAAILIVPEVRVFRMFCR